MNPQVIHLYALISLRALADYDPVEFRRSTDLSKGEVDKRIEKNLKELEDSNDPQREDVKRTIGELNAAERTFLGQLGSSYLLKAQELALEYARMATPTARELPIRSTPSISSTEPRLVESEDEFTTLGVMRLLTELLKDFPDYLPKFNYRVPNGQIDALLESRVEDLPVILIEAKTRLQSLKQTREASAHLRQMATAWKKRVMGLLTAKVDESAKEKAANRGPDNVHILTFDPATNEFEKQGVQALLKAVHAARESG